MCKYHRDEPALNDSETIPNFRASNSTALFKFKQQITGKADAANGIQDVEVMVPLNYLSSFWRTLEIPLSNFEINLISHDEFALINRF